MFKLTAAFFSICYGSFFSLRHPECASPYGAFGVGDLFWFFCFFLHASPRVTKTKHLPRGPMQFSAAGRIRLLSSYLFFSAF